MDFATITAGLKQGLTTVQSLSALAALGGPQAAIVGAITSSVASAGREVLELIEQGVIVATSDDKAQVKEILAQLQGENDELARRVAAS